MAQLSVTIDLCGGLELVFDNKRNFDIELDGSDIWNIRKLLEYMINNFKLTKDKEYFVQDNTVTPGILVLINETDWELLGKENYELKTNDKITFISTLHGG